MLRLALCPNCGTPCQHGTNPRILVVLNTAGEEERRVVLCGRCYDEWQGELAAATARWAGEQADAG